MQRTLTLLWCTRTTTTICSQDAYDVHSNIATYCAVTHLASCKASNPYYALHDEALARSTHTKVTTYSQYTLAWNRHVYGGIHYQTIDNHDTIKKIHDHWPSRFFSFLILSALFFDRSFHYSDSCTEALPCKSWTLLHYHTYAYRKWRIYDLSIWFEMQNRIILHDMNAKSNNMQKDYVLCVALCYYSTSVLPKL